MNLTQDDLRSISVSEVLTRLECVPDPRNNEKWRTINGEVITVRDDFMVYSHALEKGGAGAIDATQLVTDWGFGKTLGWLRKVALDPAVTISPTKPMIRHDDAAPRVFIQPKSDPRALPAVVRYLVQARRLPDDLVDSLIGRGDIYAVSECFETEERDDYRSATEGVTCYRTRTIINAVFVRRDLAGAAVGIVQRGVVGEFKQTMGRKDAGCFAVGNQDAPRVLAIVESPIDAISIVQLNPAAGMLAISTDGSGHPYLPLIERFPGADIWLAQDADEAGDRMANAMLKEFVGLGRSAIRHRPEGAKDWNALL